MTRFTRRPGMMITILILVGTQAIISASTIKGRICELAEGENLLVHQLQPGIIILHSMKNYASVKPSSFYIYLSDECLSYLTAEKNNVLKIKSISILSPLNYCS